MVKALYLSDDGSSQYPIVPHGYILGALIVQKKNVILTIASCTKEGSEYENSTML